MVSLIDTTLVGEKPATPQAPDPAASVLVLGVGNLLMGDEGVGVHVIRALENTGFIPGAQILDGGTGGANLLGTFEGRRAVVLVDATRDGQPAGTVAYRYRRECRSFQLPQGLSAHDFGLKDLFAAAALLDTLPELHLFTIAVEEVRPMCTELSTPVADTVAPLAASVRGLAERLVAGK